MIADFATMLVDPPRVRCIGVEVKPFSLGHKLILQFTGNSFITAEPDVKDLPAAAAMCAHTWEENQKLLRSSMRRNCTLGLWGMFAGRFNEDVQAAILYRYIAQAVDSPEPKTSRNSTVRYLFSDWDTRLFNHLRRIGYTESEALNMPLQKANLLFIAQLEENDKINLKSRRDLARDDAMRAILEKMESEGVAA